MASIKDLTENECKEMETLCATERKYAKSGTDQEFMDASEAVHRFFEKHHLNVDDHDPGDMGENCLF